MNAPIRLFSVSALICAWFAAVAAAPVEGKFLSNGKDGKLVFAMATKGEPFMDEPVTVVILSEKDASKDKRPDFHAQMGDLGDAIVLHIASGEHGTRVVGSELTHSGSKHPGVSASGIYELTDVATTNGELSAHLKTRPKSDIFGEPIDIDLRFRVRQP